MSASTNPESRCAQLEQELEEQRNRHRAFVDSLPVAWAWHEVVLDEQGKPCDYVFLDVNPAFEEITGLHATAIVGRHVTEVFPGIRQQEPDLVAAYGEVAVNGGTRELEFHFEPLGRWFKVTVRSPEPGTFTCVFSDITAEKQVASNENLFFEVVLDMLCIAGFDGYFKRLSPSWGRTLGWTDAELMARPFMDFVHPEDQAPTQQAAARLAEGREVVDFVNRYQCRDGSWRWLSWRSFSVPEKSLILAAARDITAQKQAEALQARQQDQLASLVEERTAELRRTQERLTAQAREVLELSTPVMQIWEGIVVAPLIGTLDSQRTQRFMERLLTAIADHQAEIALIDVTGVPVIDTQTARNLLETTHAVRLLGARVVLTGIRPAIAQTLVHLGIQLDDIVTRSSLSAGVRYALDYLGKQIEAR